MNYLNNVGMIVETEYPEFGYTEICTGRWQYLAWGNNSAGQGVENAITVGIGYATESDLLADMKRFAEGVWGLVDLETTAKDQRLAIIEADLFFSREVNSELAKTIVDLQKRIAILEKREDER